MYEKWKSLVKGILPSSFLRKHEYTLRSFVARRYKGVKQECNICDFKLAKFIVLKNGDQLCPNCGSLPRTRRLFQILQEDQKLAEKTILHFSPPQSLRTKLQSGVCDSYITSDFEGEFEADQRYDITCINEINDRFDLILCYHVLEHIEADLSAMKELYRILKRKGICYIQTPFKEGAIYEDASLTTEEERRLHFGQKDHVRIYSVEGLTQRLEAVGFEVETLHFKTDPKNYHGLNSRETVLKAIK